MKTALSNRIAPLALLASLASLSACERAFDVSTGLDANSSGGAASKLPSGPVPGLQLAVEPTLDHVADDDVQIINNTDPGSASTASNSADSSGGSGAVATNPSLPSDIKSGVCPGALNPGLFQLGGRTLRVSGSATLKANIMLGPNAAGRLSGSVILQSLVKDPSASWLTEGNVIVSKSRTADVSVNAQAGAAASSTAAALAPTHASMDLAPATDSNVLHIVGNGGLNVIQVSNIDLQGSNSLTLTGGANDTFVFNVSGRFRVGGSFALNLEGGIKPGSVLFNVIGDGQDVLVTGSSSLRGTILAPRRSVTLEGSSLLQGAIVAGGDINLQGSVGAFKQATLCDTK